MVKAGAVVSKMLDSLEKIKPELKESYRRLCSDTIPFTTNYSAMIRVENACIAKNRKIAFLNYKTTIHLFPYLLVLQ